MPSSYSYWGPTKVIGNAAATEGKGAGNGSGQVRSGPWQSRKKTPSYLLHYLPPWIDGYYDKTFRTAHYSPPGSVAHKAGENEIISLGNTIDRMDDDDKKLKISCWLNGLRLYQRTGVSERWCVSWGGATANRKTRQGCRILVSIESWLP